MASDNDILNPKSIVIPSSTPALQNHAELGSLIMSGAKLYVCVSTGVFELVTSS